MTTPTIYIQFAAYRDPEAYWTLRSAFDQARDPLRLRAGVCWQVAPEDAPECSAVPGVWAQQIHGVQVAPEDSLGACWAKAEAGRFRADSDYTLLIDSHMRFAPGWDQGLIEELARCPSPQPVLSTYPAPYTPPDQLTELTPILVAGQFYAETRVLHLKALSPQLQAPWPTAFVSGGFIFGHSRMFDSVPYDPALYFQGEEACYSARLWTHGWDPFCPSRCLVYHYYKREGPKHWGDNREWGVLETASRRRICHLLGIEATDDPRTLRELGGRYGLGRVRTLAQYQHYAGVDFAAQTIEPRAQRGEFDLAYAQAVRAGGRAGVAG